jgi:uncharacterized protein Smg (DUF494 family)
VPRLPAVPGQHGILDADQRELVLDRAMALDQDELDLDDLSGSC